MDTDKIPTAEISDWEPMSNKADLAAIGKLGEEAGELCAIISRCIIQGIHGVDPDTGVPNLTELENEIADVQALSIIAMDRLRLNSSAISDRVSRKIQYKVPWIKKLAEQD